MVSIAAAARFLNVLSSHLGLEQLLFEIDVEIVVLLHR